MNTDPQPGIFQDKGVFLNYGHVDKSFMYSIQKNCPQEVILVFFLQDTLKTAFLNENLNHRRTQTGHFFAKSGNFFCKIRALFSYFQKKRRGDLPPS